MASQAERQTNLLTDCVKSLKLWKELIDNHLEGEEKEAETSELQEIVKEYCLADFNATNTSEACQEVEDYFNSDSADQNIDIEDLYKEKLANKETNFASDFSQHRIWKEVFFGMVDRDVEEVEPRPSQMVADTEYEEMQDSILCSNVFTPPVDPISKKVIQEPYKNRVCGHVYEYKFILQYIKSMKSKAKCPYMGCGNRNIAVGDLIEDRETKTKINDYLNTNSMSDED